MFSNEWNVCLVCGQKLSNNDWIEGMCVNRRCNIQENGICVRRYVQHDSDFRFLLDGTPGTMRQHVILVRTTG